MRFVTGVIVAAGAAMLAGRPLGAQTVHGQVVEQGTNAAVGAGAVTLLDAGGSQVARAPVAGGRFTVAARAAGRYQLRFQGVGYRTTYTWPFDLAAGGTLAFTLQVRAQTAVTLDTVDVAGEAVSTRLLAFHQRRARGLGEFLTRQEFERFYPARITDVLRRTPGLTVVPNPYFGARGDMREYLIYNTRLSVVEALDCPPLVFLDGAYAGTTATLNVDDYLAVEFVEAVETYNGASNTPIEFSRPGSDCGVVSLWSRTTADHPALGGRHLELGLQLGARVAAGGLTEGRFGGQVSITFLGPLDLYGGVNLVPGASAHGTPTARPAWQAFVSLRGRPLGQGSPWYAGTGVSVLQVWREEIPGFETREEISQHVLLAGVALPIGSVKPVLEMHVLDVFRPGRREVNLFTGFAARLY